jgi:hypothetical protein
MAFPVTSLDGGGVWALIQVRAHRDHARQTQGPHPALPDNPGGRARHGGDHRSHSASDRITWRPCWAGIRAGAAHALALSDEDAGDQELTDYEAAAGQLWAEHHRTVDAAGRPTLLAAFHRGCVDEMNSEPSQPRPWRSMRWPSEAPSADSVAQDNGAARLEAMAPKGPNGRGHERLSEGMAARPRLLPIVSPSGASDQS